MADLKAQLEITADASGVESGVSRAKKSIASLGQTAAAAGKQASDSVAGIGESAAPAVAKVDAATKSLIASIQRTTVALDSGGRSSRQYFELLAQQRGASPEVLRPYLEQLDSVVKKQDAARTALVAGAGGLNAYGQSAKQTAAALRQVPAQLTDIFTGLASGQAPLTVLIQQGGQLRDVFGGIRPALSAVGGAVVGLINPFTVAATAVGALGLAYFQGSKEADEFAKSLILTGNTAGKTVGQLQGIAAAVSGVVGTQGKAAEVVAQLAATGQVAGDNLQKVAIAVIKLERDAGKSIDKTVQEFAELGKEPVKASERLNEKYNFLTLSVYEQIKALQEQGRATDAAALAQRSFADASIERADKLTERLGILQRAWRFASDAAKEFWDAALDVGRQETPEERLESLREQLNNRIQRGPLNQTPGVVGSFEKGNTALRQQIAALEASTKASADAAAAEAERNKVQQAGIAASKEIERIREASRTNQQKLNAELKSYRDNLDAIRKADPNSILLDPARIKADEQAIRARFKTAAPAARDDAAVRMLQSLREAESVSRAQLTVDKELTASEQKKAEFVQLIADLKEKRVLTADQKSLLAAQEAIKAQLDRNIAVEKEVKARADATKEIEKQQRALEQFQDRAAQLAQSIRTANANRSDQNADRLSAFGRGDAAREQLQAQISIQREFQRYQEQLDKATPKDLLGSDLYKQETDRIRAELGRALALNRQYYADLAIAQADWANGATRAFENYLSDARNVAGQVEDLLGNAFTGLEDALVEFTTTGKLSFSDLATSIVADINRIIVKQALIKPLEDLLAGAQSGEGLGGLLSKGLSGLFGGSLKVPGFAGGQIDPAKAAQDTAAAAATGALTAAVSGATAATVADTAATASATASKAALAAAETAAAAAIATASASSSLALAGLATSAGAAATALAAVAANAGTEAGGDVLGSFLSIVSGGRANGGPVSAGSAYRINERGAPEIATLGGKDYLLTGSQGGRVTPASGGAGQTVYAPITIAVSGQIDRRTADHVARQAQRAVESVIARGTA